MRKDSWYEKEVNDLFLNGIISGYRDGKFYPYHTITRAEAVAMIGRAKNLQEKKAKPHFQMFHTIILLLVILIVQQKKEIISGYPDKTFKPSIQYY